MLVVRLTDLKVVRSLAVPDQPHGIEAVDGGGAALVLSEQSGTITCSTRTRRKVRRVLEGFESPRYAAGDPAAARSAYVSDDAAGQVIAIDVPRARVIGRVEVGEGARHISISPDGTRVVTSLGTKAPRLALVDVSRPRRPRLLRTFPADDLAHDVGFSPDGRQLWISSGVDQRLAVHDAQHAAAAAHARRRWAAAARDVRRDRRSASTWPAARAARCASTGWPTPGSWARARIPAGSFNVCAQAGRVITPSLERGHAHAARPPGPAQHARRAERARRVPRGRRASDVPCRRWPASRPSRRAALNAM